MYICVNRMTSLFMLDLHHHQHQPWHQCLCQYHQHQYLYTTNTSICNISLNSSVKHDNNTYTTNISNISLDYSIDHNIMPVSLPVLPTSVLASMTILSSTFTSQEQSAEVITIQKHYCYNYSIQTHKLCLQVLIFFCVMYNGSCHSHRRMPLITWMMMMIWQMTAVKKMRIL